jgi:hypothetical protein
MSTREERKMKRAARRAKRKAFFEKAMSNVVPKIKSFIQKVEDIGEELTGPQKKEIVVDMLNDVIDIPFLPEDWEEALLSTLIDQIVGMYNSHDLWGHKDHVEAVVEGAKDVKEAVDAKDVDGIIDAVKDTAEAVQS